MSINYRIHDLIEKRGISVEQLSRDAGIDPETLQNSLHSNIPFKGAVVLSKLAKFFHVSVFWLITGQDENKETERRLNELITENNKLIKEVSLLKGFIAKNVPLNYDVYLGTKQQSGS